MLNITVQANSALPFHYVGRPIFPLEVLLPMHLVSYNNNLRKLLLYGSETSLPAAIVAWLLQSTQYKNLFTVNKEIGSQVDR